MWRSGGIIVSTNGKALARRPRDPAAPVGGVDMRAIVYDHYGGIDALRIDDVAVPVPEADQVLIEVAATSINLSDWETLTGSPAYSRINGLRRPRRRILGSDIAGTVISTGDGVTNFQPGDEVYADNILGKGGFAQYAVVSDSLLAHKPPELSWAQASTIPQAGAIAWQGTAGVGPGNKVLINGAGGGSGMFALQRAKQLGAHVTGVDNSFKLQHMHSLGADEVIDYQHEDFTQHRGQYDVILDLVAHRSIFAYRRALAPSGQYRAVGGSTRAILRILSLGSFAGLLTRRRIGVLVVRQGPQYFRPLASQCAAGEISVHIDRTFELDAVPEALRYVGEGRALGKVVVTQ